MKKCSKCGEVKPLDEFNKDKTKKTGLSYKCRACYSVDKAAWRKDNIEKCRLTAAAYRKANPEKYKVITAAYRKRYHEKIKTKMSDWRIKNLEKIKDAAMAYNKAMPDAYVKASIYKQCGLSKELIPQELIQAKRAHIQINRKLKELKA